jgi:hypothetical protein
VAFGGIFAEAWNRAATVGNAVSGFRSCGMFPFSPNQLPEHVFSPGIVHVHSEVTVVETVPRVVTETKAVKTSTVNSDEIAPERQEFPHLLPVSAVRSNFEDISPIPSTSQTKKRKTGESEVLTDPKYIQKLKERKASASERKKRNAEKITFKRARQENQVLLQCPFAPPLPYMVT